MKRAAPCCTVPLHSCCLCVRVPQGMAFKWYHGKTGVVWNVTKRAVGVEVNKMVRRVRPRGVLCRVRVGVYRRGGVQDVLQVFIDCQLHVDCARQWHVRAAGPLVSRGKGAASQHRTAPCVVPTAAA
jgi:hypothetical protein